MIPSPRCRFPRLPGRVSLGLAGALLLVSVAGTGSRGPSGTTDPGAPPALPPTLLSVLPTGPTEVRNSVSVIFTQPMVSLGSPAPTLREGERYFRIRPRPAGSFRWTGTRTLSYMVPGGLPRATVFHGTVRAGAKTLDGTPIGTGFEWTFHTPGPRLVQSYPTKHDFHVRPEDWFVFAFDQPVAPRELARRLTLNGVRRWIVEIQEDGDLDGARVAFPGFPRGQVLRARPEPPLALDRPYHLILDGRLTGRLGGIPMGEDVQVIFRTYGPLRLRRSGGTHLEFTNPVDPESLMASMSVDPGLEGLNLEGRPRQDFHLRIDPGDSVRVTLSPRLPDIFGQRLGSRITALLYSPLPGLPFRFTPGRGSFPLDAPRRVVFHAPPGKEIVVRAVRLTPREAHVVPSQTPPYPVPPRAIKPFAETWDLERTYPESAAVCDTLDLSSLLLPGRPGVVLLEAEGDFPRMERRQIRSVITWSDLDVLAHMSERGGVAWVLRRSDREPVPGARISIRRDRDRDRPPDWSARTGPDGVAMLPVRGPILVEEGRDGVTVPWWPWVDFGRRARLAASGRMRFEKHRAFLFGDRSIYRPGDTLRVCGLVRRTTVLGLDLPELSRVHARIWTRPDPVDTLLDVDSMGGFHLEWKIPATIPTGPLRITIRETTVSHRLADRTVSVEAFRAPDFSARIEAGPEDLFPEGTVTSRIGAAFYFGAPVAGAGVSWTLRPEPRAYLDPLYPEFRFWDPGILHGSGHLPLHERGVLSRQGTLELARRLPPDLPPVFQELQIEAEVRSPSGDVVAARDTVRFHPASIVPGIHLPRYYLAQGDTAVAEIVAVDPVTGEAIPGRRLRVEWRRFLRWAGAYGVPGSPAIEDSLVQGMTVVSESAPLSIRWKPPTAGRYWLRVRAVDDRGRAATAGGLLDVAGATRRRVFDRKEQEDEDLHLDAAEGPWSPGDTLRVYLEAPPGAKRALVTVERETVLDARIQDLEPGANVIAVPVREAYRPNAYVGVTLPAPPVPRKDAAEPVPVVELPAARVGYLAFQVETESRHLRVQAATDRPAYAPGDTVRVTVRVRTPDGPAPSSWVTVCAVDRAVLALTAPERPDPFPFFYRSRVLEVGLSDSRAGPREHMTRTQSSTRHLMQGPRVTRSTGFSFPPVRKNFAVTCLWAPGRRTDAQGVATLTFICPDNLTGFRVTAVAAAGRDRFGTGTTGFRVRRPLAVVPALPRFLRAQDRVDLAALVVNDSGEEVRGSLEISAPGIRLRTGSRVSVRLRPGQSRRVAFPARVPDRTVLDTSRVVFRLAADGSGDAVETPLPVVPLRVPRVSTTAGHTRAVGREAVYLPEASIPGTATLDVTLATSALAGADQALEYVRRYPFGCLEQVSSRLLALICFRNLLAAFPDTAGSAARDAEIRETIRSLDAFHRGVGEFSFWPDQSRRASPYLNGYVLFALLAARQAGFEVGLSLEAEGRDLLAWIGGLGDDRRDEVIEKVPVGWLVFVAGELRRGGVPVPPFPVLSKVALSHADGLSEESRLFLALALRDTPDGGPLLRRESEWVRNLMILSASTAYLPAFGNPRINRAFCSADRATALALLVTVAAADEEIATRLAVGLLDRRRDGHWKNTQADALALWALDRYRAAFESRQAKLPVAVRLPGLAVDLAETLPGGYGRIAHRLDLGSLARGDTTPLLFENRGSGTLFYSGVVRWDEDPRLAPPRDNGLSLERRVEPLPGPAGSGPTVTVGDLLVVTLVVGVPEESRYLAIRDPLPAGLEPVIQTLQVESREAGRTFAGLLREFAPLPVSHLDLRDREVRVFADFAAPGIYEFRYLARARAAGTFTQPPATIEAMYAPEQNGASEPGRVVIDARD